MFEVYKKDYPKIKKYYKEFFGKSKNFNRLMNCSYDFNYNDFVFLKPPFQNKEIPCDYKISNFIKYLWDKGIITFGSNQPNDRIKDFGFITFSLFTINKKCSKMLIEKLLGKKYIFFYDQDNSVGEELIKMQNQISKENPKKILFEVSKEKDSFHSISFNEIILKKIHNILNINFVLKEKIIPGFFNI